MHGGSCNIQAQRIFYIVILYIQLVAKWGDSLDGQTATFDMDIVEQLHGIVSRGRLGRILLTIMNLENICLNEKNKTFEFVIYLKRCYPKIYDTINECIFKSYKITRHMEQEKIKRKAIDKAVLGYYMDRVGVVGSKNKSNLSNSIENNDKRANKANLN